MTTENGMGDNAMRDNGRASMGIGEVLTVLKSEFPDVSVSKIRFLESEGLVQPERTASKYRRFTAKDLERLRWILRLQKDSFLPLKVIKERLAAADAGIVSADQIAVPTQAPVVVHVPAPANEAVVESQPPQPAAPADDPLQDLRAPASAMELTESDVANEAGLELSQVRALASFGVLCAHGPNNAQYFDATDLEIAKVAREFLKVGLEARHLKTLRRLAEQEADLYTQIVTPVMRMRRPEARDQAAETLAELATLSRQLRRAYFMQSLRATLNG